MKLDLTAGVVTSNVNTQFVAATHWLIGFRNSKSNSNVDCLYYLLFWSLVIS